MLGTLDAVEDVPLERLEEEMRSLAGHLAAGTCAFLVMVGEYDARRGWESWQALSCAHWLSWRCGVGIVAAREQVRVARRLRELPVVREEFAAGRLSYSKVRAVTRVAHPAIERQLVELAQDSTASQLERCCAALRRTQDEQRADAELRADEERAAARRSLRWYHDDDGDLVVRARIPAGPDAEAFLARLGERTVTEPADGEPLEDLECRRLDALVDLVAAGAEVESSLAPQPEVVVHVDASQGCGCDAEHGTRVDPARDPAAAQAAAAGPLAPPDAPPCRWPIRTSRGAQLSSAFLAQLGCDAGFRAVVEHAGAASDGAPDGSEHDGARDLGRHRRFPSRALRRAVFRRDGGCCRFPSCTRRHRLHVHHIVFWEHGGRTDRANLLLLCPAHHRAVHRGGWTIHGTASDATFRRPDGRRSEPVPAPVGGTLAELVDANRRSGRDIALDGAGSGWLGDRIDWDCFFAAFADGTRSILLADQQATGATPER